MKKRKGNFDLLSHFSCYVPGVADIFVLLFWFLIGNLIGSVITVVLNLIYGGNAPIDVTMLIVYPISFIPVMIYASIASTRKRFYNLDAQELPLDSNNFGSKGGLLCALMALIATFGVAFVGDYFTSLLPDMPDWLEKTMNSLTGGSLWCNLLCVAVFAPFFEEWLCRGIILRGLLNYKRRDGSTMKPVWAIVISAAFFAVIHLNPWQAIPAFMIGMMMGYVYFKTGSLKLTMLMHCFNNASAVLLMHTERFAEAESWASVLPPVAYWLVFVCCIISTALVVLFYKESC